MFYRRGRFVVPVLALFAGSCQKPEFTHRVGVLRFEGLTPDPSLDWIGRAISEEVSGQLQGTRHNAVLSFGTIHRFEQAMGDRPVSASGMSAEYNAAVVAGANRIVSGYYSYENRVLRISALELNVENLGTERQLQYSGSMDDLLHLTDQIARAIDEEARPAITGSARALRSYALGLERPGDARALFEEAIGLDPDFGPAYAQLGQMALDAKDQARFEAVFAQARARGGGLRAVDRAALNLMDARLRHAERQAGAGPVVDALGALVKLEPADPVRLEELADGELQANRFDEAADHYRKLGALMPARAAPLNMLGYALMYSGDQESAMRVFGEYRAGTEGKDANAFDSTGDAEFFFGHYAQAERDYLEAHKRDAILDDGAELLKAAWTRVMLKDAAGARQYVARYEAERAPLHDAAASLHAAQILRLLGDKPALPVELDQAKWWAFLDGDGPLPDQKELGQAVSALAKKDYSSAAPLWRKLAETATPEEWWVRRVYARVAGETGQKKEQAKYGRFTPPAQPNRAVSLDELWMGK